MELKQFISNTLAEIAEGVNNAKPIYDSMGGIVNPRDFTYPSKDLSHFYIQDKRYFPSYIEFEVALTQDKSSKSSGGIGVLLGSISAGGKTGTEEAMTALTKIKFTIPVVLR